MDRWRQRFEAQIGGAPMSNDNSLGFIGLGNMGEPMCERLLAAGHLVIAFDLDDTNVSHAGSHGADKRYSSDVGKLFVAKRLEDETSLSFRMDDDWTLPWKATD
ncbi:MAG: NAD(P)-binding domain-containing protein [Ilumatobacter sp.]|nr:NAD(P)-binding domain-containing protein [Ilumatobacter sp.]